MASGGLVLETDPTGLAGIASGRRGAGGTCEAAEDEGGEGFVCCVGVGGCLTGFVAVSTS